MDSGKSEAFLKYKQVEIHFIYSFTWDIKSFPWSTVAGQCQEKGWELQGLHQRTFYLEDGESKIFKTYQPNILLNTESLERRDFILKDAQLIVPYPNKTGNFSQKEDKVICDLFYTLRLFDNGTGTCTFCIALKERAATFKNVHLAFKLSREIRFAANSESGIPPSHPYLAIREATKVQEPYFFEDVPDYKVPERFILGHLILRLSMSPPTWVPKNGKTFWFDHFAHFQRPNKGESANGAPDNKEDSIRKGAQSPYVCTIAEVDEDSYRRISNPDSHRTDKEIASMLCKMALDRASIEKDYLHFSEDYLETFLNYDAQRKILRNRCLDDRLFFSMSRRGAVAITADLRKTPSNFVVPSLLNLCEILRSRWHLGNLVNFHADRIIKAILLPRCDMKSTQEMLFEARAMFAMFLRDPVPYLFDGGSITELAEAAEEYFWLEKLNRETLNKFNMIDRLVEDVFEKIRIEELLGLSGRKVQEEAR